MKNKDLRKAGLKVTPPRLKVLKILENANPHHLTAEDIYKELLNQDEDVGLATVYRVLTQFENSGLIRRHHFEGGQSVYELEQGEHHDHLVCVKCSKVEEFFDEVIEKRQEEIARQKGFQTTDHHHIIYGLCHNCRDLK